MARPAIDQIPPGPDLADIALVCTLFEECERRIREDRNPARVANIVRWTPILRAAWLRVGTTAFARQIATVYIDLFGEPPDDRPDEHGDGR